MMTGYVILTKSIIFTLAGLVVLGFGIGGFSASAAPVSAQVHTESIEIFRGQSDFYEVAVTVFPRVPIVGPVHFSVEVLDATTMNTVTDARVLLVVHDEDDVPTIQTLVLNTPLAPDSYEGSLTFELPARYTLRVDVDSPTLGTATFRLPLTVRQGTPIENPQGTWIFLVVVAALVGGTVYVVFSAKKAQRRRSAA